MERGQVTDWRNFYFGLVPQYRRRQARTDRPFSANGSVGAGQCVMRGILAVGAKDQHTKRAASPFKSASSGLSCATSFCSAR